ncbi:MAG: hypothetical protein JNM82_03965 [Rhodocyclaceae bacterium]|nr:hypothetical protein [Rhodocyclaceae bacterium]
MRNRQSRCPLCGGDLTAIAMLDACRELLDAELGVIAGRCPHCQGYLELAPGEGGLRLGYVVRAAGLARFDAVQTLACADMRVDRIAGDRPGLRVCAGDRRWEFCPA